MPQYYINMGKTVANFKFLFIYLTDLFLHVFHLIEVPSLREKGTPIVLT